MIRLDPLALPLQGVNLIEASAGTGKTFTITTLFLRLLLEEKRRLGEILVVTYTNAATAELRTRLRARLAAALLAIEAALAGDSSPATDEELAALVARRAAAGTLEQDRHRLTLALYGFDEAAVFTIHGFCQRILQENAFESGMPFDARLVTDQRSLVREIVRDFWVRELHQGPASFVEHVQAIHDILDDLTGLASRVVGLRDLPVLPPRSALPQKEGADDATRLLILRVELVEHVRDELRRRKEEANILYFDDLLTRLRDGLRGPGGELLARAVRQRYRAALIDEFQDTDPVQYRIFRTIYGPQATRDDAAPLFLIGDPKQAIYGFRGADVYTYIEAKRDAGEERSRTLDTNYRSDPDLLTAVNTLFGRAGVRAPFLLPGIEFEAVVPRAGAGSGPGGALAGAAPFQFLHVAESGPKSLEKTVVRNRLYHDVPHEIARLLAGEGTLDGRRLRASDVAVLCRKNDEARALQHELRRLRIPSVLQTDESVLETSEAEEMARIVRALAEPGDSGALLAAIATPMLGVHASEIQELRDGEGEWDLWTGRFHRWREIWGSAGFMPAFRALLHECAVESRVLGSVDGERRMTNFLHLAEILQTSAVESRRGPLGLAEWFTEVCREREARTDAVADAAQIRLESDDLALKLVTVHKSKGLEYPIVFCPFLWDGRLLLGRDKKEVRFHAPQPDGPHFAAALDIGSPQKGARERIAASEALAENLRLLYVALTRARHRCVVVWGRMKEAETSALGYLLHQDPRDDDRTLPPDLHERIEARAARACTRLEGLDDEQLLADLRRLVAASGGTIEVSTLSRDEGPTYQRRDEVGAEPECREPARILRLGWRTASFSSLTAGGEHLSAPAEEGVDRDESNVGMDAAADEGAPPPSISPSAPSESPVSPVAGPIALADFPAGTRAGQLVHAIFEHHDFGAPLAILRARVDETLAAYGFESRWAEPLARAVSDVLATPLSAGGATFRLADVPVGARLNELEFLFSLRERDDGGGLDSGALARAFARHARALRPEYLERLRHLGFAPVAGYLKGFVDLVFVHDRRWYIVDWKSNHLGPEPRRYEPARLVAAMEQHHYYLQYHLYAVALHRYLGLRLPDYDYERHFGGVFYLFVRGMTPRTSSNGVFFDRPPRPLVEALSALF